MFLMMCLSVGRKRFRFTERDRIDDRLNRLQFARAGFSQFLRKILWGLNFWFDTEFMVPATLWGRHMVRYPRVRLDSGAEA